MKTLMATLLKTRKSNLTMTTAKAPGLKTRRRHFARAAWLSALAGLAFAAVAQRASAAIPASERQVLVDIYTSTNGATWTRNTGWNGAAGTECTWYGITCDSTQSHVSKISFYNNNLTGTLPALTGLTNLTHFYVGKNRLTGPIPALTGLTNLDKFSAGRNQLTGPIPALTGLTNLTDFIVEANQLTDSLPALTGLTNLAFFSAGANQLTGPIPDLTGLTNLSHFSVGDNQLTGHIPALTGLTNLLNFYVDRNQLTGPIPALTGSTNLVFFRVNDNQLTGTLPALTGLTNLFGFEVGHNQLSGPVPAAPASLWDARSSLCPNLLDTTPGANDAGWNTATGHTPWWAAPYANNRCDDFFTDGFEGD